MLTITEAEMYWVVKLDSICIFCVVATLILSVSAILGYFVGCVDKGIYPEGSIQNNKALAMQRTAIRACLLAIPFALGAVFVPTTKEYAAIKIIPAIANSQAVQQDVPELYKLAVEWAKDGLKPKAEKK